MLVIPTYNERENIRPLLKRIRQVLPSVPIFFIDDNSPDGTAAEIRLVQTQDPLVRLWSRPKKQGLGSAYRDAFLRLLSEPDIEYLIALDADLSHPPEILPEIISHLRQHSLVVGSRYIPGGRVENWNWFRRLISRVSNWYACAFTGIPVKDLTSGFVGYRAEALRRLPLSDFRSEGYAFQIEMKSGLHASGAKIVEIPIVFTERREGNSKFSFAIILEAAVYPLKVWFSKWLQVDMFFSHLKKYSFPGVLFFSSLLTYILTMPRTIHLGDNAEYITAAATLGIPHPSGYPVYVMLGKLFSLLPFSTIAFRVNLLSAVATSVGLVFFFCVLKYVFRRYAQSVTNFHISELVLNWCSFAVCALFAYSPLVWQQANTAQPYALHFLIFTMLLWLVLKFWESPKSKYLLWGSLLSGLGLGNHEMLILLLPFFAAAVAPYGHNSKWTGKLAGWGLFFLGLSAYLYLPLRSLMEPAYQWGNAGASLGGFFDHVLRADYADVGFSSFRDKARYFYDFLLAAQAQFSALLWWSLFGVIAIFRADKRLLLLLLGLFIGNVGGIIFLRSLPYSEIGGLIFVKYCVTSLAVLAVLLGLGGMEIFRLLSAPFKKLAAMPGIAAMLILLLPVSGYGVNFISNDWHNFRFLEDYSASLLKSLPADSVLLVSLEGVSTDSVNFSLLYQLTVNRARPDVTVAGLPQIFKTSDEPVLNRIMGTGTIADQRKGLVAYALAKPEFFSRPIFTTFLVETLDPAAQWTSYSNGLVYRLFTESPPLVQQARGFELLSENDERLLSQNAYGRDLLAQYYYAQASDLIQNGDLESSQALYIKAIEVDEDPTGFDTFAYRAHREKFLERRNKNL